MAETTPDATYNLRNVPKTYSNFSGIELPERSLQSQTFLKPLFKIGDSTTPTHVKTTSIPLAEIYGTTALTSGSTVRALNVHMTASTATSAIVETGRFNLYANIRTGSWVNALVARIEYGASGSAAGGMSAALCAEMNLPGAEQDGGRYYCADFYLNAPTNWVDAGSGHPVGWLSFQAGGAAVGEFDDHGYFMTLSGLTGEATHLLSLTSQTARVLIGTATTRYMVLSQMEDGLGLGNTSSHMVLTAASTRAVDIYTDYSGTGPSWAINIDSTMGTTGVTGGVMYSCLTVDAVVPGSYIMNTFIKADFASVLTTAGFGAGNALMVELVNPTDGSGGGEFHVLSLEWTGATADTMHGNAGIPSSFIQFQTYGTAKADIDDHGYLFTISGCTPADHHLVDNSNTDIDFIADVLIKINIGGTEYWLGACDNEAGTS